MLWINESAKEKSLYEHNYIFCFIMAIILVEF